MKHRGLSTSAHRVGVILLAMLVTAIVVARLGASASSGSRGPAADKSERTITARAAHRGNPWLNLQDGREQATTYVAARESQAASTHAQPNLDQARPLSLASNDLNVDGFPDLACGYATANGGLVVLHFGDPEAFGPTKPETIEGIKNGQFPASFLPDAAVLSVPEAPDFLAVGDFDRDGRLDILTAARGSSEIYFLSEDQNHEFGAPQGLSLPGQITALATGRDNTSPFGDLAVGINSGLGPQVLFYSTTRSLLEETPAIYALPAEATSIAIGQLDDKVPTDIAVAAGNEVLVIHGSGDRTPNRKSAAAFYQSQIERIDFSSPLANLAIGDFVPDRENRMELAVLSSDGTIHIEARGQLNTTPMTAAEVFAQRQKIEAMRERGDFGVADMSPWRPDQSESWSEAQSMTVSAPAPDQGFSKALLVSSNIATAAGDELVMLDSSGRQVVVLLNDADPQTGQMVSAERNSVSIDIEGAPVAVLPMRLGVMGQPGLVVLSQGKTDPILMPAAPLVTFPVTKTADTNDGTCNADCSLREAIVASNANGTGADIITFNAGINPTLTIVGGGAAENAAATGDLDVNGNLTITGNAPTTISTTYTSACGDCKVFGMDQTGGFPGIAVSFSGVTIQNGFNNGAAFCGTFFETGGGMDFFLQSTGNVFSMTNCIVQSSTATGCAASHGGGVNVDSANTATVGGASAGTVTFTSCTFTKNTSAAEGGGLNLAADKHDVNVTSCTIGGALAADSNQTTDATRGNGGGIDIEHSFGGTVTISGSTTVRNNTAARAGGGINITFNPNISITGATIQDNTANSSGSGSAAGGGVVINPTGVAGFTPTITLSGCTISTNHSDAGAVAQGGGVYFNSPYSATVSNCAISGNTSDRGAGIFNGGSSAGATLTVNSGSTISTNAATGPGGGIANVDSTGATTILNGITVDSNTSGSGGDGLDQTLDAGGTGSTMTLQGTINVNGGDSIFISRGTFNSTSGTLNLTGNFTNSGGTFNATGGTVNCNGSGAQTIGGTTAMTFNNLTINNAAGVNLGNSETVAGTLTLTNGVLGVGTNTLTLNGPVSFTSGTIGSSATGTVNYNQGAGGQNVAPGSYGNLTFSNFAKVLPNGLTVGIAGTFTTGSGVPTITGSLVDFNGAGAQTVPVFNFNNLTISGNRGGGTVTLAAGTIGVAGIFNPSATNVVYSKAGNTFDFNGAGTQTVPAFDFNSLTISNTHGANAVTLVNGGTIGIAETFTPGTSTFTITGNTVSFNGAGVQTIPAFNFNNLTVTNTHGANAVTLVNGGTIGVAGTFTPGTSTFTITGNTMDFNGAGAQTIPAFNFNNLTSSNVGARTLAGSGTIGVAGTFTPGGNAYTITGSTVNFNGTGAQTVPTFNFNNLTISGAHGVNNVTLVNGGTIGVAGNFSPTATFAGGNYVVTNNTVDFNGTGAQSVGAPFNFNNLTISGNHGGAAITLAAGTIGIAGTFSPTATNNTYVTTGNTVNFNGTALQTIPAFSFGGLTLTNVANANLSGNVTVNGALLLASGALGVGTNTLTLNGAASFGAGTLTSGTTGTVNYNQGSNGQATVLAANYGNLTFSNFSKTLAGSGTIGIAGTFTPGSGTGHTITGSTINFNGAGAQTIPGFTYNNLTSSGGGVARTLDPVNTIKIAGVFTPGTDVYTITGSTIEYNGTSAQTLPSSGFNTYNNLTLNNAAGTTGFAGLTVNGLIKVMAGTFTSSSNYNNVQIDLGATMVATAASTINVSGNWTNNGGTFTPNTGTVNFNGGVGQTIGGTAATTFNNLTNSNASGLSMSFNNTVNGVLALTSSDITVAATRTLTQPVGGTSSGGFDVNGQVQRNGFVTGGAALSFGNPFNSIQVTAGTAPANIVVNLARSVPTGGQGFPTAVQRTYTITPSTTAFTATVRLHYLPGELNGNTAAALNLWRFDSTLPTPGWRPNPATARDCAAGCTTNLSNFWVERSGVTSFSPWTLNSTVSPTASGGVITGRIVDGSGNPVEGAVVRLQGTQNRKFITDANGVYRFDNVETNGFYTVTPARANYSFNPSTRSFSQLGETTEAAFGATLAGSNFVNPLDTPEYFVRQHYLDFLGREPDEAGFNFWSDQTIECGTDQNCVERRRENVSAAYFLSIEFQQTGGLVDGLYRVSYGVRPQFAAFLPDTRTVGRGVVVGNPGWEATLRANKEAFVNSFVNRPAFRAAFDNLSNEDYVATLISHTGVSFTAGERDALVSGLANGTQTRAEALRSIAENSRFVNAKFNEAFVMMEYFGYLRRDPDASGYAFWLNKLNEFNGNFEQADMVKAFIVSGEFRDRFPR